MTTMAGQCVVVLCVVLGLFGSVHSQDLVSFSKSFETVTGVLIPCGSQCAVKNYQKGYQAIEKNIIASSGASTEIQKYLNDNNLLSGASSYQHVYDALLKEGNSPICGWYTKYGETIEADLGQICGAGIQNALTELMDSFKTFICRSGSTAPNYLACVTHPSLLSASTSPYVQCVNNLAPVFQSITSLNYYNDLILKSTLYNSLKDFGTCIGNAIKTVTDSPAIACDIAGPKITTYIVDGINYFDFTASGKDYVRCFAKGAWHNKLIPCGSAFINDLNAALPAGSDVFTRINATLYKGETAAFKGPYNTFSKCVKDATTQACSGDTDSIDLIEKALLRLDHVYDDDTANDNEKCGGTSITPGLPLLVGAVLVLLSTFLRLH